MNHRLKKRGRRWVLVLAALVLTGLVRSPVESALQSRLERDGLLPPPPDVDAWQMMGQSAFLATLGGLRSLVAVYLSLSAFEGWRAQDWERVERDYAIIGRLQPKDLESWITGAWHLHTNASSNMELQEHWSPYRRALEREGWIGRGVDHLREGIANNPDSGKLWQELGWVYREKVRNPCLAADAYQKAMNLAGSMGYTRRFFGYMLAECPGRGEEAYAYLKALYDESERHHLPTLIIKIKELEDKLDIPLLLRITDPHPDELRKQQAAPPDPVAPLKNL